MSFGSNSTTHRSGRRPTSVIFKKKGKTSHFILSRRSASRDFHQILHGDRGGPGHHFRSYTFLGPIHSFAARGRHTVTCTVTCTVTYTVTCRYLFALQVKRDLLTGVLPCHEHTAILLASYIVQCQYHSNVDDSFSRLIHSVLVSFEYSCIYCHNNMTIYKPP